ncbi:MAG: cellulose synthase/poly-beta-1,6-N-acetylglucosamine synthase-like glycosyltransferase [Halocynthiibacter sp.]|jgi:cellulose synthase/poly-beta-1,6-N-acetylglucosamine synthase-like glycosyltransferase
MTSPSQHPLRPDPALGTARATVREIVTDPASLPRATEANSAARQKPSQSRKPLGQMMVELGTLSPENLVRAVAIQAREEALFGDILLAHDMVQEADLFAALAVQYNAEVADFNARAPDVRLIDIVGADTCLREGILPWYRVGNVTIVACCRPERFEELRAELSPEFGHVRMAIASETTLHHALLLSRQRHLAAFAETRVAKHESCRDWDTKPFARIGIAAGCIALALMLTAPHILFGVLCGWAILTLLLNSALKVGAAIAQTHWMQRDDASNLDSQAANNSAPMRLPTVSIMVPLFREREIAGRLIKRLSRLNYPRELLDICLVVEEDDAVTQTAVSNTKLPRWMRQIVVPRGAVKTKPRALNFALDFCRGSVIGVYDAEDAPDPDQIHKIVRRFHDRGPEVACLQGILDFYNSRTNWLSRCFTIEYATWFRLVLPGLERMGLVVPLGGTTLFFRREALEELGGWDAHNVTEDADLGIRLARHGYRTELISTVTEEEANCRFWPWVKQRSRWLKGYAMTWAVHMRNPAALWRELGAWRFFGVQLLFLGTLSQFILAPILWSFWAVPLGLWHPLRGVLPMEGFLALGLVFLASEILSVWLGVLATSGPKHRGLWLWVPTMHFYFPLGAMAAYKGLWEVIKRPYYWDKTAHGIDDIAEHTQANEATDSDASDAQDHRPSPSSAGAPAPLSGLRPAPPQPAEILVLRNPIQAPKPLQTPSRTQAISAALKTPICAPLSAEALGKTAPQPAPPNLLILKNPSALSAPEKRPALPKASPPPIHSRPSLFFEPSLLIAE